jgi:hypothetical protein
MDLNVALLHEDMWDKQGDKVTTSLTLIDMHDIARSATTYGVKQFFVVHPSPAMRKLAHTLRGHWEEGFGATYNPNRKEAFEILHIAQSLDEAVMKIEMRTGMPPVLVATSAKEGDNRISFADFRKQLRFSTTPYLLLLGTGWGIGEELLSKAEFFLEPIKGSGGYNHLSVRSACAIMLDRLLAKK